MSAYECNLRAPLYIALPANPLINCVTLSLMRVASAPLCHRQAAAQLTRHHSPRMPPKPIIPQIPACQVTLPVA